MEVLEDRTGIIKQGKRTFSRIGFAGVVLIAVMYIAVFALTAIGGALPDSEFFKSDLYMALCNTVPIYAVAMPAAFLVMLGMQKSVPDRSTMKTREFFTYLCIGWFFMQAGAMVSSVVGALLDTVLGVDSADMINEALGNMTLLETFITLCILAPLGEEFIFRKLIVDRTRRFGEGPSIVISALLFSLYHTNIDQFIYAFMLGAFFAYIYQRHGNIWYTVLLHSIMNLIGGMIPTLLERIEAPTLELPSGLGDGEMLELSGGLDLESLGLDTTLPLMLFSMATMALAVLGVIFFVKNVRKVKLMPVESGLKKGEYVSAMLRNPGVIIYMVVTLALTVFNYIAMMMV